MRIERSKLRLEKIEPNLPPPGLFDRVPMADPNLPETFFEDAVKGGDQLFYLVNTETGQKLVLTCFRFDEVRHEIELLATQSLVQGYRFTVDCLPIAEEKARELGAKSLRIATLRPGLIGLCEKQGYRIAEVILRKDLTPTTK